MKTYPIPAHVLREIVNYLQMQRYADVAGILATINAIVVATDQPPQPPQQPQQPLNGKDDKPSVQ